MNDNLAGTFLEMARRGNAAKQKPGLNLYCEQCGHRHKFVFVRDEGRQEIYKCPFCEHEQSYTVR